MIEIAMALVLGVAPVPEPIINEDPILPGPYRVIEQPCTALQAGYSGMVDQFCTDDADVLVGGTGAQVELGFFRARLTEGEFFEGRYITRQSWQFLEQVPGLEYRTARGAYSLACVDQDNGLIERNGPPQFVIVPAGQQSGSSTISLKTSGECGLGSEREVLSMWAFSDSELPWQNAGDFDRSLSGWENGERTFTFGQVTYTASVWQMPTYPDEGLSVVSFEMDAASRARLEGLTGNSCRNEIREMIGWTGGSRPTIQLWGVGSDNTPWSTQLDNPVWCTATSGPVVNTGSALFGGQVDMGEPNERGWARSDIQGGDVRIRVSNSSDFAADLVYWAPGRPDRFEVEGRIGLTASLTKVEGVRDLVWEPEARPFETSTVDGLCVDDLTECFTVCQDLVDPSLNPFDNFSMLWEVFQCMMLPSTDFNEFIETVWADMTGTVAYQSVEFVIWSFEDILQAPAYYARECGALVETDLNAVGQSGADQAFNTCDLDDQTRGLIFNLSGLLVAASFVFMTIRLFFYAIKQRNMLIGAQMMEDDYAAADERQNG